MEFKNQLREKLTKEDKKFIMNIFNSNEVYNIMKIHNMRLGQSLCYLNENCEANDLLFYFEDNELLKEYLIDIIYEDFYG